MTVDDAKVRASEILADPRERAAQEDALRKFGGHGVLCTTRGPMFIVEQAAGRSFTEVGRGNTPSDALQAARVGEG